MALLKFPVKYIIVMSLCTALIVIPFFLVMHTPTVILGNLVSSRLSNFLGKSLDGGEIAPLGEKEELTPQNVTDVFRFNGTSVGKEIHGLDEALKNSAMADKTILLTSLNSAWAQHDGMIDLFLGSFHEGDGIAHYLDHLLIIAFDQSAYERCIAIHKHCFRLETDGVDFTSEKYFMSADYLKMVWRKVQFMGIVLELGYNLLFSDADVLWFRDPFPLFSRDADVQIACDSFNGNSTDIGNRPNTGFMYIRSNERTISFSKNWYEARLVYSTQHDQDALASIKYNSVREFQLKMEFLPTTYFGGFCEVSQDLHKVCTMHANCCTGLERKLSDLRLTVADWRRYKSMTSQQDEDQSERVFWQAPQACLHSF